MSTSVFPSAFCPGRLFSRELDPGAAFRVRKTSRCLFGPPDHEATKKFLREEKLKYAVHQSEHYNFDFKNEQPLEGAFEWRPATPQKNIRPIKAARCISEVENEELYAAPRLLRPVARKPNATDAASRSPQIQKRITDFMQVKKRSFAETKKGESIPQEIPAKIMKIS